MAKRQSKRAEAPAAPPWSPLAICADPHVGNHARWGGAVVNGRNWRCEVTLEVLRRAVSRAQDVGCAAFIVAGDLFHSRRPEPAVIAAVQQVFAIAPMPVLVVPGNHDMLDASAAGGNTACAPLWREATVVNNPKVYELGGWAVGAVPFDSVSPMRDYLPRAIAELEWPAAIPPERRVLVTHVGVYGSKPEPWMERARDAISAQALLLLLQQHGVRHAFVGNYHDYGVWHDDGAAIVQVGTLCPASFSDEGFEDRGFLWVHRPAGLAGPVAVPGPRFVTVLSTAGAETVAYNARSGAQRDNAVFLRQRGGERLDPAEVEALAQYVHEPGRGEARSEGAGGAVARSTPEEAIREYIAANVPEERRSAVSALVAELWARGSG